MLFPRPVDRRMEIGGGGRPETLGRGSVMTGEDVQQAHPPLRGGRGVGGGAAVMLASSPAARRSVDRCARDGAVHGRVDCGNQLLRAGTGARGGELRTFQRRETRWGGSGGSPDLVQRRSPGERKKKHGRGRRGVFDREEREESRLSRSFLWHTGDRGVVGRCAAGQVQG